MNAGPRSRAGGLAIEIYATALSQVRADLLMRQAVEIEGDSLRIYSRNLDLDRFKRCLVIAVGKAAVPMAREASALLGPKLSGGLVVTKEGYGEPVDGLEVIESSHPVPDMRSLDAGERILTIARSCTEDDLVLFLLSGGASALIESPLPGVLLEDLRRTNEALLASGADITLMNVVRSRISAIKSGGLARAFRRAHVEVLVLSDVVGNSLSSVGSGPFSPPISVPVPVSILDALPPPVRAEVLSGDLIPQPVPQVNHAVIGSVSVAVHAAADAARARDLEPLAYQDPMKGEAREMARRIVALAKRHIEARPGEPFCMVFGGETTVTLRGHGKGGRCQEMAVAAAPAVAKLAGVAFLAAGTDGTDGPTDAAGGIVEAETFSRAKASGLSQRQALVEHDAYPYLEAVGSLVKTGPTGSNVNDICLVVFAPGTNPL
jgi:glycerate-2-kinase